jgi:hypothetical protein
MENLMEEVLAVSLMDVLLASLSLKLTYKRILTEGGQVRAELQLPERKLIHVEYFQEFRKELLQELQSMYLCPILIKEEMTIMRCH